MVRQASVEIGGTPPKGETKVRRAFCSPDKLVERPAEGINTMADVLQHSLKSEWQPYAVFFKSDKDGPQQSNRSRAGKIE